MLVAANEMKLTYRRTYEREQRELQKSRLPVMSPWHFDHGSAAIFSSVYLVAERHSGAFKFSRMCLVKISLHLNQFCKLFHHSGDITSIQPGYMFFLVAILHTKCAQCAMNIYSSRWWIMLSVYSNERTVMIKQNHHLWRLWFPPKTVWIINELHWLLGLKKVNSMSAIV